ncbi:MAG: 50S ribosomal protein L15 [Synergistaceae bacterium]|nr:50S ribosomal protein L15 [Synergistaceae bacterium]MBQ3759053.1 50S ribosomal protein L15 [Synergistaceae bacterium]MBR0248294.1 50S ribosomal protein L15 [Synergistaceae bacterium]
MTLQDLHPVKGSTHKAKRLGQGIGSGTGKTSGKGNKGDKARTGGGVRPGFEGGQMPITRRTPKRGFNNARFAKVWQVVNLDVLDKKFDAGAEVDAEAMYAARIIRKKNIPVKVLADGELTKALKIKAGAFSKGALKKIEAAGGTAVGTPQSGHEVE